MKPITIFTDKDGKVHSKIEEEKKMKKTYNVHYSFYFSDSIEIEAESEEEAKLKCEEMLAKEEIGNVLEMDLGDQNVWVD